MAKPVDNRIAELRNAKGWSQADLGARVKPRTSDVQISRLENSGRRLTLDWLRRIAGALGCKVSDLLIDADVSEPLSPDERAALALLREEPWQAGELAQVMRAVKQMIGRLSRQAPAGHTPLPGDPYTVTALVDAWTDLDDEQRTRAVDLIRAAARLGGHFGEPANKAA